MVTYEQIFEAFYKYAASREQGAWCDLWILTQRREEALVKAHMKGRPPLDDIDGIITDATGKALKSMMLADVVTVDKISEVCWKGCMHTITEYFASLKRWRNMEKMVSMLNSAKHY